MTSIGSKLTKSFGSKFNYGLTDYNEEFTLVNNKLMLSRIKIISIIIILTYPISFYFNYFEYIFVTDSSFMQILKNIHFIGFIQAVVFLCMDKFLKKKKDSKQSSWASFIIYIYIMIYILLAAITSLNGARFEGNLDLYTVVAIGVAVIFPMKPTNSFIIYLFNHLFYLIYLTTLLADPLSLLSKQLNTTGGIVTAIVIVYSSYTSQRNNYVFKVKLKDVESNFRTLFEINPHPVVLSGFEDGIIKLINRQALDYYQLSEGNDAKADSSIIFKNSKERVALIKKLYKKGQIKNHVIHQQLPKGQRWFMVNYQLVDYENQQCILAGVTDITALKQTESKLEKFATLDMLTGVLNRRSGLELLNTYYLKAKKQTAKFTLCFVDINNLKEVNDTFGHPEGDFLIKTICNIINSHLDNDDFLFRFGGDEFIIVFPNKPIASGQFIWSKIVGEFLTTNENSNIPYTLSASHGFSYYQSGMDLSLEEVIETADVEMYKEKMILKKQTSGTILK